MSGADPPRDDPSAASASELVALALLVGLVVASPWPFGSVHPVAVRVLSLTALVSTFVVTAVQAGSRGLAVPAVPVWPLLGILGVGVLQLLPLPAGLHALLAPASHEVWHPADPAVAVLLGPGPRPISLDPDATGAWLAFVSGLLGLAWVAAPALARRRSAVPAVLAVSVAGLAVTVYGVVARTLFGPLLYGRIVVPTISPFGPFVNKNHFAGYAEMATLLSLGLAVGLADHERAGRSSLGWIESPRAWRVLVAFGGAVAMGLSVLVSLSRGGAVSLAGGCLALVAIRGIVRQGRAAGWRYRAAALVLATTVVVSALAVLPREAHERLQSLGGVASDTAASFRMDVWKDTARMAASSPLVGQGMGSFRQAFPRFKRSQGELRVEHAENDYLEMLADGGTLGLGLCLAAVVLLGRRVLGDLERSGDRLLRGMRTGALAGMAALLVHSAYDFNLRIPSNATLFAFLAALALGMQVSPPTRLSPLVSWMTVLLVMAALSVALATPWPAALPSAGEEIQRAYALRDPRSRALRLARAESILVERLRRHPAEAEAWLSLGWARAASGRVDEGASLARHAVGLDPQWPALRAEYRRLFDPEEAR